MEYKVWHFLLTTQTPFVQHDESGKSKLHLCFIRCTFAEGCRYEANDATHDYRIPDFSSHFSGRVAIQFSTVGKEKTTVLQDLRKICMPQASLSDEAWEKLMLSDENNKQHIREAIVAMERNNQSNYWEALGKVECPDM